ncbi:hypothetical protein ENSA7_30780 [Enhygromyxa salina]|uniref:Uncharacterized protein n=1 Tax=Enhygromyxa salina TaxID=215803 RepID=A0A2S9YQL2_9BACT|nr:hypothetical protein ENSA7_30780 [Enhygromyxa salina]
MQTGGDRADRRGPGGQAGTGLLPVYGRETNPVVGQHSCELSKRRRRRLECRSMLRAAPPAENDEDTEGWQGACALLNSHARPPGTTRDES